MKRSSLTFLLMSAFLLSATPPAFAEAPATAQSVATRSAATRSVTTRSATTQATRPFLWHITTANGASAGALVGSVHLATDEFYPLADIFYTTFDNADVLAVEVDVTKIDQARMQQMVMTAGLYPPPDALSKHVSKETLDALKTYGKLPPALTEKMKPWLLATLITMQEIQALGFDPKLGIDHHFLTKAEEAGKKVVELETAQAQFDLLSGFDAEMQEKFLADALRDLPDLHGKMDLITIAWKRGDGAMLQKELIDKTIERDPASKPVMEKLFDERNLAMAGKIDAMIKAGGKPFVVVGAGHLVGEKGLVTLLTEKGYKLEQAGSSAATTKPATRESRTPALVP